MLRFWSSVCLPLSIQIYFFMLTPQQPVPLTTGTSSPVPWCLNTKSLKIQLTFICYIVHNAISQGIFRTNHNHCNIFLPTPFRNSTEVGRLQICEHNVCVFTLQSVQEATSFSLYKYSCKDSEIKMVPQMEYPLIDEVSHSEGILL